MRPQNWLLGKHTFRNNIMEIVQDFVEKYNYNGKSLKSSKIFVEISKGFAFFIF